MKKLFSLLIVFTVLFCSCQSAEKQECSCIGHPAMLYNGIHYINPDMPVTELPEGYEYAGMVSEEMGHKTGNKDIPFYTKDGSDDFYTYQMTGTYIGGNMIDNTKQALHYIQWIPIDEE